MFVGGVVDDEVEEHFETEGVRGREESGHIGDVAVGFVDFFVVADVVACGVVLGVSEILFFVSLFFSFFLVMF